MNKDELLQQITGYYFNSTDFNGCPSYLLVDYDVEELADLIENKRVRILSDADDINIYINRLNLFKSIAEQVQTVRSNNTFVAYPTIEHLQTINISEEKPFSKMLASGCEHLKILYFSVDILELYASNPQYSMLDYGYRGCISLTNECYEENDQIHTEYIQDFGVAYPIEEPRDGDRAIAVFVGDLARLNFEAQYKWRGFLLPDQNRFRVNGGFIKNLLMGEWVENYWIFDALLDEIRYLNAMCSDIGIPDLFRKEYSREDNELIGYRILLIPTLKNYYDFVSALEKIVINNLSFDIFKGKALGIKPIERKKEDGSLKGSIEMLEEWLNLNYCHDHPTVLEALKKDIVDVFRNVRRIRQTPAHEMYLNKHDKTLYKQQNELIIQMYDALDALCFVFSRHPRTKNTPVPDSYAEREKIVIY